MQKGDEDPFISFRSRKARLAGEWKATDVVINGEKADLSTVSIVYIFNKDGSGESIYTDDMGTETSKFHWDFLGKDGDYKNKERVKLTLDNNPDNTVIDIVMLKNKKMKWHITDTEAGQTEVTDATLEPR